MSLQTDAGVATQEATEGVSLQPITTQQPATSFPHFLDLPIELRTRIYEYICTEPIYIHLSLFHSRKSRQVRQVYFQTLYPHGRTLHLVNHEARRETQRLVKSLKIFSAVNRTGKPRSLSIYPEFTKFVLSVRLSSELWGQDRESVGSVWVPVLSQVDHIIFHTRDEFVSKRAAGQVETNLRRNFLSYFPCLKSMILVDSFDWRVVARRSQMVPIEPGDMVSLFRQKTIRKSLEGDYQGDYEHVPVEKEGDEPGRLKGKVPYAELMLKRRPFVPPAEVPRV